MCVCERECTVWFGSNCPASALHSPLVQTVIGWLQTHTHTHTHTRTRLSGWPSEVIPLIPVMSTCLALRGGVGSGWVMGGGGGGGG